jgi:hypothetical protein
MTVENNFDADLGLAIFLYGLMGHLYIFNTKYCLDMILLPKSKISSILHTLQECIGGVRRRSAPHTLARREKLTPLAPFLECLSILILLIVSSDANCAGGPQICSATWLGRSRLGWQGPAGLH